MITQMIGCDECGRQLELNEEAQNPYVELTELVGEFNGKTIELEGKDYCCLDCMMKAIRREFAKTIPATI